MKKIFVTLLILSVVTAQLSLSGALGMLYGTLDTLEVAFTTIENIVPGNLFHGTQATTDVKSLGTTTNNPDGDERYVWDLIAEYLRINDIAGIREVNVTSVKPYLVTLTNTVEELSTTTGDNVYDCIQIEVGAIIYGHLPYYATWCFPVDPKDDSLFFVSKGGNSYQSVNRNNDFIGAIQISGIKFNNWVCSEPPSDSRTTLLEAWNNLIYD